MKAEHLLKEFTENFQTLSLIASSFPSLSGGERGRFRLIQIPFHPREATLLKIKSGSVENQWGLS